jgi:outer membrane protein TolC
MRNRFLFLVFLVVAKTSFSQATDTIKVGSISIQSVFDYVNAFHPVVKQAKLLPQQARFEIREARGFFDPKFAGDFAEKRFDDKFYFNNLNAMLKVPAWIGDFKGGLERNRGIFVNGENSTPEAGLLYAGYSLPLGAGLFIDERRNALRQAQELTKIAEAEQVKLINKTLLNVSNDYWEWYFSWRQLDFVSTADSLAKQRFRFVKEVASYGNSSMLDTVEAFGNMVQRNIQLEQSKLELQNARLRLSVHLWDSIARPVELSGAAIPFYINPLEYSFSLGLLDSLKSFALVNHPDLLKIEGKLSQLTFEKRFRTEMLKPTVNVDYNFLTESTTPNVAQNIFLSNNYKFGLSVGMPLFLRKERGKLQTVKTKISLQELEMIDTRRNVGVEVNTRYNELKNLEVQLKRQNELVIALQTLLSGEIIKFQNGESSLFVVNMRETNLINAGVKLAEFESKFAKSIAYLFWASGIKNWSY